MDAIDFPKTIVKFDEILERGLSKGLGQRDGQMCIEAAICAALDLPHGDNPTCVAVAIRKFKIKLNDSAWSSPTARATGLRDLGIAQIGSLGIVDDQAFATRMTLKTINVLIPDVFRKVFSSNPAMLQLAMNCEAAQDLPDAAARAARAARAAGAAGTAARVAGAAWAAGGDYYLNLSAKLALETLQELKSPGCEWI